ncbi:MAG: acyloxyacyl hydrolase [Bacteroidota bacterium]
MRSILFFSLFIFSLKSFGQSERSIGVHLGIPIIHEKLQDGFKYQPYQLLFYYNFANLMKGKKDDLFVYVEPQLVRVLFSPEGRKNEIEFGANLGLEYRLNFTDKTALIGAIGAGPHYISAETPKQANGFIFSDNFTLGLKQTIGNSGTDLHLRTRFRHISNANLKQPNQGIDSWFLIFGATKHLQ